MIKRLICIFIALLFQTSIFAQTQAQVSKQVKGLVECANYSLASDCRCHYMMYQKSIKNGRRGGVENAMLLAKQRQCMHNVYDTHYSDMGNYEKKLKQIPYSLISADDKNNGDIQAQYLFNQETMEVFKSRKEEDKANEFLDKNIEILIANMMDKGWAAKNIMRHLYAGNLTVEQKEAALQTLNTNLPKIGKCKADICKIPGTVGDVSELFTNCGEDACLLTALHVELFSSLVQSGATSVTTDQALSLLSNMLVKDIGSDKKGKSKRFGDKQANATVKIPILKAILELGNEDYYMSVTEKILEKRTLTYSDSDSEVIAFIIDSYYGMDKYDPLVDMALNQTKNKVAQIEANISLAQTDYPEVLSEEEKQKIANILHYAYASETTACPEYYNDMRLGGSPVLAGVINTTQTDAILKQEICEAYTKLGVKGTNDRQPCYPCEGNLGKDGQTLVAETLLSFFLDDAVDDAVFAVLTLGTGLVAKKMIQAPKYIKKAQNIARKVNTIRKINNKTNIYDGVMAGVKVTKKTRKASKARNYVMKTLDNGKTVAKWTDNATDVVKTADNTSDALKSGKKVSQAQPDITVKIKSEAEGFGNKLDGNAELPGYNKDIKTPTSKTGKQSLAEGDRPKGVANIQDMSPSQPSVRPERNPSALPQTTEPTKVADATENFVKTTPTPKPEPKTALNPSELGTKLTEELDQTLAKSGKTSPVPERRGIGFKPQNNISPSNTTTGAPEGMRRQIGFGNEGNYIPESAGIRDPNGPGVQNVTNGTPGQRVPDGPNARNPYDIRNSAAGTNSGTSNTPNVHQNEPRAPIKQRNDWVPPETTVQETLDAFDDQIAKLEAERKKMGLFSSREKKAALDREIEKLKGQKDKFFNSISGKTLDTHSPIYDNVILTRKAEVEEYLSKAPTGGPAMTRAQDEYVNLYNAYLSVNVDALHPAQRAEFLKSFDELSGLRFTDAISTGPEGLAYRQKILNLRSSLDGINTSVYHIKFGGAGLGEREMFAHMKSGLRQQHFGAIKDTDPSISLKSLKGEIDKLSGPNGFKEAPLVDFTAHGYLYGNPKKGTPSWHGTFGNGGDNTVAEIVDIFNDGQEYNLYFRNCHGGAAMDDFLALPTNKTKKLNMFTEAGRNQKNAVMLRSQNSSSSLGAAIDNLSYSIERGNIGSRAVINGQHYYPLETAIAQARAEGNTDLVRKLDVYKTLLDTKDPNEFSRAAREYTRLFPGSVAPSSPGFIIATNQAEVVPGKVLYIDKGTAKYVQQVSDGMLGELKGFKKARPVVPQKTNPSVIGLSGPTKKTVNTGGTTRKPILSI